MSITEQELVRNFCYKCNLKIADNSPYCPKCFNSDLIPAPKEIYGTMLKEEISIEDAKEIFPSEPSDITPNNQSKLQLDENAVHKLLTEQFGFLTGLAGCGKSTLVNELNRLYPNLLEITATTGIAAVNLGSKTIHSILKFFNYPSLENAWREQTLHYQLRLVRSRKKILLIDEISMFGADMFDLLMNAVDEINSDNTGKQLGVWITGDLCQLPAIRDKRITSPKNGQYVFKSDYWDRFEANTVRLTKIWRQDNIEFMKGINLVRAGEGKEAIEIFKSCGVNFATSVNDSFSGTTLIPKNDEVDKYNEKRLRKVDSPLIRVCSTSRGAQLNEWQRLIPFELRLKIGALVMILSNDVPEFNYVNGDTGIIEEYDEKAGQFHIRLKRNNKVVVIEQIRRLNLADKEPHSVVGNFQHYSDFKTGQWIVGTIDYFPLRLAYATSVHKSQGLSFDELQIDCRGPFFGYSSMAYVAISRARTPDKLTLVGDPKMIASKMNTSKEVTKYI